MAAITILGAHTLGRLHIRISHHKYVWKAMSGDLFNNGYFRNLASKEDWFYPTGEEHPRYPLLWCKRLGAPVLTHSAPCHCHLDFLARRAQGSTLLEAMSGTKNTCQGASGMQTRVGCDQQQPGGSTTTMRCQTRSREGRSLTAAPCSGYSTNACAPAATTTTPLAVARKSTLPVVRAHLAARRTCSSWASTRQC